MTKQELIEALEPFPDDCEVEFDFGEDENGKDLGESEILSVQEENGTIYLCPFDDDEEEDEPEGEIIDADYREIVATGART